MENLDNTFRLIFKNFYPEMWKEGTRLSHEEPVLLALLYSVDKEHLLNFLTCKFLVNLSDLPFITSDSPVILYNQFRENIGDLNGATAIASKGLQIFYPIHPRLMICFFDEIEYDYGSEDCISTELIDDVHQLNILQHLNSNSQLFFNDFITKDYIDLISETHPREENKRKSINRLITTADDRKLLYNSFKHPHIDLKLSFIELINKDVRKGEVMELRHQSFYKN